MPRLKWLDFVKWTCPCSVVIFFIFFVSHFLLALPFTIVRGLTWWMASSANSMKAAANLGKSSSHLLNISMGIFLCKILRWLSKHVHCEIIYAFHIVSRRTRQCLLHFIDVYFRCSLCVVLSSFRRLKFSSKCESKFIFRFLSVTSTYPSLVWLRTV